MGYRITPLEIFNDFVDLHHINRDNVADWYPSGYMEITVRMLDDDKFAYDYISKTSRYLGKLYTDDKVDDITEEMFKEEFARRLRKKIKHKGMSIEDFAIAAGISKQSLHKYLNGTSIPSAYVLMKISTTLNCSISELTDFRSL